MIIIVLMVTLVTSGIRISVVPKQDPKYLEPGAWSHFFIYEVEVENLNDYPVKLLGREWHIFDCVGEKRLVEGKGVVGERPVIQPNDTYRYQSACDLQGPIGYMEGKYLMQNFISKEQFYVDIPRFNLEVLHTMN